MKITFAVLGLVAVVAIALALYNRHLAQLYESSPEGQALAAASAIATRDRNAIQDRVDTLAADRCAAPAMRLIALHKSKAIVSEQDIPATLRGDLALCVERGVTSRYVRDQLRDADLLRFLEQPS